jgi:hypothetical protein
MKLYVFPRLIYFPIIFGSTAIAAKIGSQAPAFALTDTAGTQVTLSPFKGKTVAVNFRAIPETWPRAIKKCSLTGLWNKKSTARFALRLSTRRRYWRSLMIRQEK